MSIVAETSLRVGVNVDIQRTDGRVHSAVVSGINEETQSVTVEWFEHNETKGKELELEAILRLNPQLASIPDVLPSKEVVPKRAKSAVDETPRNLSRLPSAKDRKSYIPSRPMSSHNVRNGVSDEDAATVAAPYTVKKENVAPDPVSKKNNAPRKSNCVKEVERIKEEREKRRAAANAVNQNVIVDKSNPNWQFIQMIQDYQETLEFQPLRNDDPIEDHQICVCVRKRPLNKKELGRKDVDVVTIPNKQNVIVHEPKLKVDLTKFLENQQFRFDYAFDEETDNDMVYRYTAQPLVQCIFEGGMATCFAYGQTGSGKTHTMGGEFIGKGQQDCNKGIYALSTHDVFRLLHSKYKKSDLVVGVSFFEIYSGKVFDLLGDKAKLRILEDGKGQVQIVGLKEEAVTNVEQVLKLLSHGTQVRTSGQTSANQHSSRSHAIFQLILRKNTKYRPLHGKFSLIDLAGNERGADTSSADRQTRMEGAEINKSLLALKECIRALGRKGAHLPFRASKLTLVLRDSFMGDNARTCMISTISPGNTCCEHTLNTLRYADRVKELGPGGPVSEPSKIYDDDSQFSQHPMSPQNSDLVLLKTANQEEVSDDLLNFHEVINHMQDLEEEIIDEHRTIVDMTGDTPAKCATIHYYNRHKKCFSGSIATLPTVINKDVAYHKRPHYMGKWQQEDSKLLKTTERVDYDVESYAKHLDNLLAVRIDHLTKLRQKVMSFRQDLENEESISRKFKKK